MKRYPTFKTENDHQLFPGGGYKFEFKDVCATALLAILFFFFPGVSFSQINPPEEVEQKQEEILERIVEQDENQSFDYENLVDLEINLRRHPLNLNKASKLDFQPFFDLKLLSEIQVNSILEHRQHLGNFISIYELQAVPYMDVATIRTILPYVFVTSDLNTVQTSIGEMLSKGDYMILIRASQILEEQQGFSEPDSNSTSRYLGSPLNLYARYRYNFGTKFSYGITGQKDPGEEFLQGTQPNGFDFYSAHIFYRGNGFLKGAALGDYELNFGQGLIAGAGFGVSKSSFITSVKNGGRTMRAYTSADEFNFFRGGAISLGSNRITATLFGSYKKMDGNIGSVDTLDENVFVTSIGGDGYHRTESELADKNMISEKIFGGNLEYETDRFSAGATFLQIGFSSPLIPSNDPYNIFDFQGDELNNYGLHFDWQYRNFNLFGEGVKNDPGGTGVVSGMLISVDPKVELAFIYRNYSRDFNSIYANGFGESSTNQNESGMYSGVIIRPVRKWEIDAYADFFHKPWLSFGVDAPLNGIDYLVQVNYKPSKTFSMYLRWKDEKKQANSSLNDMPADYLVNTNQRNLRLHISYKASPSVTLNSRAEWVWFEEEFMETEKGFLVYQDIVYKVLGFPLQLTGRFCLFDADDYDARIYAYENDVLYSYTVPAFSDRGIRWYLLARYNVTRGIDLWLRFAQTYYSNLDVISSSLDEIQGNKKSEVKAEVRFRF